MTRNMQLTRINLVAPLAKHWANQPNKLNNRRKREIDIYALLEQEV